MIGLKKWKIGMVAAVGLLLSTPTVFAMENFTAIYLDAMTMVERGFTVRSADDAMILSIPPRVFTEGGHVVMHPYDPASTPFPGGWIAASDAVIYNIEMAQPRMLQAPITVQMRLTQASHTAPQMFFYDFSKKAWQPLSTRWNKPAGMVSAPLRFPYAPVVVLDRMQSQTVPTRITEGIPTVLASRSAIVMDAASGNVLFEQQADEVWPLASLTKMMTASVLLDQQVDFKKTTTYVQEDQTTGGILHILPGDQITMGDHWMAMLVGSANNSANTLVRFSGLSRIAFIAAMNQKASALGLPHLSFVDPHGLSDRNVGSAREYAEFIRKTTGDVRIIQAATVPQHVIPLRNRVHERTVRNTNKLLGRAGMEFTAAKTGYIDESGYNFMARVKNPKGNELVIVVFGSPTAQGRFTDTKNLANWAWSHFTW